MTIKHLSPKEAQPLLESESATLLDVREPWELEIAPVPGAKHIPMNQIPGRLAELSPEQPVLVLCHSGIRSQNVAQFLDQSGFKDVSNITGGTEAWRLEVDPNVPSY